MPITWDARTPSLEYVTRVTLVRGARTPREAAAPGAAEDGPVMSTVKYLSARMEAALSRAR
jgi:hypothetical protein